MSVTDTAAVCALVWSPRRVVCCVESIPCISGRIRQFMADVMPETQWTAVVALKREGNASMFSLAMPLQLCKNHPGPSSCLTETMGHS